MIVWTLDNGVVYTADSLTAQRITVIVGRGHRTQPIMRTAHDTVQAMCFSIGAFVISTESIQPGQRVVILPGYDAVQANDNLERVDNCQGTVRDLTDTGAWIDTDAALSFVPYRYFNLIKEN